MRKTKNQVEKIRGIIEQLLLVKTGYNPQEMVLEYLVLDYGNNFEIWEFNLVVSFTILDVDPEGDTIAKEIRERNHKLFEFFSQISLDQKGNIVSKTKLPNINFEKYLTGILLESLSYRFGDELKMTMRVISETIEIEE